MSEVVTVTIDAIHCIACPENAEVNQSYSLLSFELDAPSRTAGYRFPSGGAVVVLDPNGQFISSSTYPDGTVAMVDLNNLPGTHEYNYDVTVILPLQSEERRISLAAHASTLPGSVTFDPSIQNDY